MIPNLIVGESLLYVGVEGGEGGVFDWSDNKGGSSVLLLYKANLNSFLWFHCQLKKNINHIVTVLFGINILHTI